MDCSVWGVPRLDINKSPEDISDSLVHKNKEMMGSLKRDTLAMTCKWYRSRVRQWWQLMAISLNNVIPNIMVFHLFLTALKSYIF
jgi:hypothetical protein